MPWSAKDAKKYKKGLTDKQAKKWAEIANSVYNQCKKDNGKKCAEKAIRTANSKVGSSKNSEGGGNVSLIKKKIPKKGMYFTEDDVGIKLKASEEGGETDVVSMSAYSGKILKGHWLWGDLAIDVSGIQFDKKRIPILEQHDLSRKIGVSNSKPKTDEGKVEFEKINLLSNETASEFKQNLDEGFPYQASMGLRPLVIEELGDDQTAEVNGLKMKGPGTIFRKCEFREASVCVFGFDQDTSVSSLSDETEEFDVEVVNLSSDNGNKQTKNMEEKSMTIEELKEQYPDLYKEIQGQFDEKDKNYTALKNQYDELVKERDELKGKTENLSDSVKQYEDRVKKLEKAEELRKAKDLQAQANSIIDAKLESYEIPARLHDKVRKQIDHNEFVDDGGNLDVEKFTEKAESEVKDWATTLSDIQSNNTVLGFGGGERTSSSDKENEAENLANTMLSYVGVSASNE